MLITHPMLRLDRLLTLGLFRPLMRMKLMEKRPGIPILMYHSISDDIQPNTHPYYQTSTSPATFRRHMAFLKENGYAVLPLREAVALLKSGCAHGRKAVVLTFDDGFRDFFTEAFPVLQAYGYPCTVFLPTVFVDNQDETFNGKNCLSWEQVRALQNDGVAFGSHTVTHPELTALSRDDLKTELELSRRTIEFGLGEPVESFSYPFAFPEEDIEFTRILKQTLQEAGYRYGVTTRIGTCRGREDPLFLKRIPVNEEDDLDFLKAKLDGAYDWVYPLQKLFKHLKRMFKNCQCKPGKIGGALSAFAARNPKPHASSTGRQDQRAAA